MQTFKKLTILAVPVLISQLTQMGMTLSDTIMSGRVSATDMAAISIGAAIWLPLVLFGQGFLMALTPTISYLNGADKRGEIAHQVRQGYWIVLGLTIPIFLIIFNSHFIINIMNMPHKLAETSTSYLTMMSFGVLPYLLLNNYRGLTDGISKTKASMLISIFGLILNIPLNYILIYGHFGLPEFGAVGCGIATTFVNFIMLFLYITYCRSHHAIRDIKLFEKCFEPIDKATIIKLSRLGLPIALTLCAEVAFFTIVSLLLSPLGSDVVASNQIALQASSVVFMLPLSIGIAATILVGTHLGQGDTEGARKVGKRAFLLGVSTALITASITVLFRYQIPYIFVNNQQVALIAANLLLLAALYQISDAIQVIAGGVLRGYKDTRSILIITLFCYWVIAMPIGYTLGLTDLFTDSMGPKGFWIAFVVALTCAAVLLVARLRKIQSLPHEDLIKK